MMRLWLFLAFFFWQIPAWAVAPAMPVEQAFIKDAGRTMNIEQASASTFRTYRGSLSLGFASAAWVRLTLHPAHDTGPGPAARRVIRVGPNNLERIDLYLPGPQGWQLQSQGALLPRIAKYSSTDDMYSFEVDASVREVYLRIEHEGFLVAHIDALSADEVPQAVAQRVRRLTVSLMIAMGLLALGLGFLIADRTLLLLAYCSFQFSIVVFLASNTGLLAQIFPGASPEWLNRLNGLVYVLRVATTSWLVWAVLQAHKPTRAYLRGAQGMFGVCVVSALLVMTGHAMPAMQASLVVFSIIPFWHLYGIASAGALPRQQRRILTAGSLIYILMLSLGLWLSFSDQSWLPASGSIQQILDWRLNGFAIGVVFFWITMLEHASQKRIRAQEVETLRQQALQARSQRVEINDRSALIDMLTHELKNPLATVRFALASLKQQAQGHKEWLTRIQNIDASVRRMDDLIERVAHFSKIERITAADRSAVLDPAALIQELLSDVSRADRWDIAVEPGLRMQGDRQLLMVILENLMTNASKYAARSHKIRIRASLEQAQPHGQDAASSPASFARVEISNHVDPASLPDERRLFDRYYRHPHAQSHPGMGLGLSVVRTAAQKMGAQVLYRHEGDQVFFTLRMPT